ncbi:MAG: cobalt-precorrin-6A reductase [Hyphomicrobiales bacterium]|nr:cobalt-precorrin-6A reductase [Hyphomicrobiales bacterium]MDE2114714.1 cobalt-precorrin-6A reductase [Hyphomicrobiales bacterium]
MTSRITPFAPRRVLVLGGTGEANALIDAIASIPEIEPILSLAGRTAMPKLPAIATRIGGFGGIEGLRAYLKAERIALVVDATHPYAAQMSGHTQAACTAVGLDCLRLARPGWTPREGDDWRRVENVAGAIAALGEAPQRVFLTHGRLELDRFAQAAQHFYLVRAIEPPEDFDKLPRAQLILARGPFGERDELALMQAARISRLVSKDSGGDATYGKIAAARALQVPVILLQRPASPAALAVGSVAEAVAWLRAHVTAP